MVLIPSTPPVYPVPGPAYDTYRTDTLLPRPPRPLPAETKLAESAFSPTGVLRPFTAHSDALRYLLLKVVIK